MTKYTLVVLARDKSAFLERLQGLGMVDVTTAEWQPDEEDRALMSRIEERTEAVKYLATIEPVSGSAAGYDDFVEARERISELEEEIVVEQRLADKLRSLGGFDVSKLRQLIDAGVSLETLGLDAIPDRNYLQIEDHIVQLRKEFDVQQAIVARTAGNIDAIRQETEALKDRLQLDKAKRSGESAVDGQLVVMEAWARAAQEMDVDALLKDTLYVKERPTPEDETPVELKNDKFASPFEFIGNLYAKPRYGRMDLTRWFAPFFMLFFGLCMADFGYGTVIFLAGIAGVIFVREDSIRSLCRLTMMCGATAMVVGFIMGSGFGVSFSGWEFFSPVKRFFISSDKMFTLAIGIGVFQVMFAMVLNIITRARAFGLRYALANIGWVVILVACILRFGLRVEGLWFLVAMGVGAILMLFFDSPGKNVFVNVGGGLYATFNRVTGLLGDALSYIRLFAIGLSGGVLAMVFNRIATEVSPDIPVVGQLVTLVILFFGHTLNLFMSTLSAVVHPLRLTFVEFFNNAGFEAAGRDFDPLRRRD